MRLRIAVFGLSALVVTAGALAIRAAGWAPGRGALAAGSQAPVMVTVVPAAKDDLTVRFLASGTVTSLREAKIAVNASGRVAEVLVDEGQRVQAGTPLLRLDTDELRAEEARARADAEAARARLDAVLIGARPEERRRIADQAARAQAAVAAARVRLTFAQAEAERMRTLYSEGASSRQQLDSAATQAELAQAELAQAQAAADDAQQNVRLVQLGPRSEEVRAARAQVAQAEAAVAAVRVRIRDRTVVAAFAGTIVRRSVEPGEAVSPITPAFVLAQLDDVFAELAVPERHVAAVRIGQQALLQVDGVPGRVFTGRVEEIRPAATAASRSVGVKVRVPNSERLLRPGMFTHGVIIVEVRRGVLMVPERAMIPTASGPMVFVEHAGRALRRSITLGERQAGRVEVTAGLRPGDRVIVDGQEALAEGQTVVLRPAGP